MRYVGDVQVNLQESARDYRHHGSYALFIVNLSIVGFVFDTAY